MNANFNSQFIMIDFKLLQNQEYLHFLGPKQGIYLLLRRYVYRSTNPHPHNLHKYFQQGKLVSSLTQEKIAELTGWSLRTISGHISDMVKSGIIQSISTGRASVYVLGERRDVSGDEDSKPKWFELFYLDRKYGMDDSDDPTNAPNSDESEPENDGFRPDTQDSAHQIRSDAEACRPDTQKAAHHNINIINKKIHKKSNNRIYEIPVLKQPSEKTEFIADEIVTALSNPKARKYYLLVASRIPEPVIRQHLAEVKADNPRDPIKLFTHKMQKYAKEYLDSDAITHNKSRVDDMKQSFMKSMHPI